MTAVTDAGPEGLAQCQPMVSGWRPISGAMSA